MKEFDSLCQEQLLVRAPTEAVCWAQGSRSLLLLQEPQHSLLLTAVVSQLTPGSQSTGLTAHT